MSMTYLVNVALHTAVLSVFAAAALCIIRQPSHRSMAAIAGLLAVGFLPWISALRPAPGKIQAEQPTVDLPSWTVATLPAESHEMAPAALPAPDVAELPDLFVSAAAIWAVGTILGWMLMGCASLRLWIWRKSLEPIDDRAWEKLQAALPGTHDRQRFLISNEAVSPCVMGFWKPSIVIPRFIFAAPSNDELAWSVRHELAHLRANDSRWMLIFVLIRCMNWWNPLVHHLVSRWADAREQVCDLHAVGISETRADYGKFLLSMAGRINTRPPLAVAMANRRLARHLKVRIVSLLRAKEVSVATAGWRTIGIGCCVVLSSAVTVSCLRIDGATEGAAAGASISTSAKTTLPASPAQVATGLWEMPRDKPLQIKISAKLIVTNPEDWLADGGIHSDGQVQLMMRDLAQKRGTSFCSTPHAVMKPGQQTTVEIVHEVPGSPEQIAARDPKFRTPFVGISLFFTPHLLDERTVDLRQIVDYRFVPNTWQPANSQDRPPAGLNPDKIKTIKRTVATRLPSGMTVCHDLGEIEPGKSLILMSTAVTLDATGKPLAKPDRK